MPVEDFFSVSDLRSVEDAIRSAELNTSGEIRVHIEDQCDDDVLDHAAYVFSELEMHKTALRNGVLIYVAVDTKKFAIIGDSGINQKVGGDFWKETRDIMTTHFRNSNFVTGLCEGIQRAGDQLKRYFPFESNDSNELSNEVTTGPIKNRLQKRRQH